MWLVALKSTWKQRTIMFTRYWFNYLSSFLTLYIVFAMLFYGAKSIGGGVLAVGNTLEGMLSGYVVWMLVLLGCTDLANNVTNEVQTGTFEQQYLSPVGYKWLALFSVAFNFVFNASAVIILTLVMSATAGQKIHLDFVSTLPVMLSVYLQAAGLGFALAGLALIYKRVQSFFQIVQFAVLGLFFVPLDKCPWAKFLPFVQTQKALQCVLMDGLRIWETSKADLLVLVTATALYLVLGTVCFSFAESKARNKGMLGQY